MYRWVLLALSLLLLMVGLGDMQAIGKRLQGPALSGRYLHMKSA